MARDRATINTAIWTSQEFRDLTVAQQQLYFLLMSHGTLNYAGVADWRPKRLAALASDLTAESLEETAAGLQAARFIFIDAETEEVLVRSFLRHDGLLKQPKLSISMVNAFASVASKQIRQVIIHELQKLNSEFPEWAAFGQPKVAELMKGEGRDMSAFTPTVTPGLTPNGGQAQGLHTATATPTATSTVVEGSGGGRRKPERPLPPDWAPNDAHKAYCQKESVNVDFQAERFRNHAAANDRRARDWDAAFRNWLLKAEKSQTPAFDPWAQEGIHA